MRRRSWGIRYECASTISVALQGGAILILCPGINRYISSVCHTVTGLWNVEDFVANILQMGAIASLLSMALGRFDVSAAEFEALVAQKIILPMTLFVPVFWAAFIFGNVGQHDSPDLWLLDPSKMTLGQRYYWTIFIWAAAFLLSRTAYVLWRVRYGQEYIASMYLGGIAMVLVSGLLLPINVGCGQVAWFLIRGALVVFSVASVVSWRRRYPTPREHAPRLRQDL
jgi:hypothetical protein